MTFTIDGIAIADKHLAREVTELVRATAPDLLSPPPAQRRGHGRSAAVAIAIGAAAIAMLASVHAFAAPPDDASAAKARHACAVVLGLDPSQAPYQDCVANIGRNLPSTEPQVLASIGAAAATMQQKARLACADAGLDPLSGAFRQCVIDVDQSLSDQTQIYR